MGWLFDRLWIDRSSRRKLGTRSFYCGFIDLNVAVFELDVVRLGRFNCFRGYRVAIRVSRCIRSATPV